MIPWLARLPIVLLAASAAVTGGQWGPGEGRFGFRAVVEGEEFEAVFRQFEAKPHLDRARIPLGFEVEVDLRNISSGNADRDAEMVTAEWFDVGRFPVARFRADDVEAVAEGAYVSHGELNLKGVTRPVDVPFSWRITPQGAQMTGEVTLDRRWFGVGPGDDSSVAATVKVFFVLAWSSDDL